MIVTRVYDADMVRELLAGDRRVYDAATDDEAPFRELFEPNMDPGIWYVTAQDLNGVAALFVLLPRGACWDIHISRAFGGRVRQAVAALLAWLRQVSGCRKLLASIPETNFAAVRLARGLGWEEIGRNRRSFFKRGRLVDQILFGTEV